VLHRPHSLPDVIDHFAAKQHRARREHSRLGAGPRIVDDELDFAVQLSTTTTEAVGDPEADVPRLAV
jgi:hypothetical protein